MTRSIVLGAVVVACLNEAASATSFQTYRERIVADSSGRYYVVVKRQPGVREDEAYGPVTLTITERRPGSAPVQSTATNPVYGEPRARRGRDATIQVRAGDTVHGRVDLAQPPGIILISSKGKGIVTLDVYGFNDIGPEKGRGDMVVYSLQGDVLHRKDRTMLWDRPTLAMFYRFDGVVAWLSDGWIDEERDAIVIVGGTNDDKSEPPPVVTVGYSSGTVRKRGTDEIVLALSTRDARTLAAALAIACELNLPGSRPALPGIIADENLPLDSRLRAAVLLASFGDRRGANLVSKTARGALEAGAGPQATEHTLEVSYAIEHLPDVAGVDALPILKQITHMNGHAHERARGRAFKKLGRKGVPTLIAILENDRLLDNKLKAIIDLEQIGPEAEEAVPSLIKVIQPDLQEKPAILSLRHAGSAARALAEIGAKANSAIPALERLARDGHDPQTKEIARAALQTIRAKADEEAIVKSNTPRH